ncbi:glycosyltransferase family 2 protein [Mitsuokella sp. AF21-1AC]|uniref:glycosyltransferase family 2 protein n=1 Tax=Mitsuokella sp. AF21-1AC TaxID=2292235 RepID=UPI001314E2BD|nr:glycosyltransferase [Mitsuokella sp. AF21-1AC]
MENRQYDISFIILTWNSEKYIEKCLQSIDTIKALSTKIYVIDNGSQDGTLSALERIKGQLIHASLEIIRLSINRGTTVSRNMGLKKACENSRYICVLDSDTIVNEAAIMQVAGILASDPTIGIIGPVLKGLDASIQNSGRAIPTLSLKVLKVLPLKNLRERGAAKEQIPKIQDVTNVGYLMSACWMMQASLVKKIGLLDENIFYAPEDVEYCMRAWKHGYRVCYAKNVSIIHAWQRLSRKKVFSKHNWEHIRGLLYLFHRYHCYFNKPDYVHYKN